MYGTDRALQINMIIAVVKSDRVDWGETFFVLNCLKLQRKKCLKLSMCILKLRQMIYDQHCFYFIVV